MSERADPATEWLVEAMDQEPHLKRLWCLDENSNARLPSGAPETLTIVSNRWDATETARVAGFTALFNDFDEQTLDQGPFDRVYCRVSKEKSLVHHLINLAGRHLKPGGELVLCGHKSEGIKTYCDKAARYLGASNKARKQGELYTARFQRGATLGAALPDNNYADARPTADHQGLTLHSKPGLYGWQKIDRGSELLWQQAHPILQERQPETLLDLGCGYGYLGLMTKTLPLNRRVMTDNNAAAIAMAQLNAERNAVNAEVIADDCARHIEEHFDAVLCNPPFHQGFSTSGDLTERFLQSAYQHLNREGVALFVVNQFIPLERKAKELFRRIETLIDRDGFKVVRLEL
ncbi:methyltransferase [Marinimicrobium agarilyticum]|uniref:methyltransferase n=1 Tax=Marinimicrobium agarilyticum TaxID=306546 RepID=UPI0003FC5A5E|nr:methyltransferase [Marinimicrobium agarilyticum]